jgi:EAL domain-containing protein (putative c-di-GMP-specific phosphodiesterase class I)
MDDFGTGHSSLTQLQCLPITRLKIDRTFVRDIPADHNNMVIAKTVIAMGRSLGLQVVAEGVETTEQKTFLVREVCELLQGSLLNKPMPAADLQHLLAELKWSGVRSVHR